MLIGGDYISNDVLSLGPCFSEFVYIHVRYALIGRNLTVVTASHRVFFRRSDRGVRRAARRKRKPRSQGSLLPALRSERERERALSLSLRRAGRREPWERGRGREGEKN